MILGLTGWSLQESWQRNNEVDGEIADLQSEIQNLEQKNQEFRELIEYFNSDAYIEEKARTDLGLKKEGEKVVIVSSNSSQSGQIANDSTNPVTTGTKDLSNLEKWWLYFFN